MPERKYANRSSTWYRASALLWGLLFCVHDAKVTNLKVSIKAIGVLHS